MAANSDFVSEQYRRITAMANEIQPLNNRLRFIVGQIKLLEDCLPESKNKTLLVKRLVSWALTTFNAFDDFKSDLIMLDLWQLLGKYSVELKMEGVMKKLYSLGFFKSKPEFYKMWAEYYASQMKIQEFDRVVQLCLRHCQLDVNQQNDIFGTLRNKCTGVHSPDCTASIMRNLEAKSFDDITTNDVLSPANVTRAKMSPQTKAPKLVLNSAKSSRLSLQTAKNKSLVALEVEKENYPIIDFHELKNRCSHDLFLFVASPCDNMSTFESKALSYGTLWKLSEYYKNNDEEINGLVLTAIGIQLADIIKRIHEMKIVHCGVNPKSLAIVSCLNYDMPIEQLLQKPLIKLVDWKNALDMRNQPVDKVFNGRIRTEWDCIEMVTRKPWTYQPDFFGYVLTIYALMFNESMSTTRENGRYRPVKSIKRRMECRSTWTYIFDKFLNIEDCNSLPSWPLIYYKLLNQLKDEVNVNPDNWERAVKSYNKTIEELE